MSCERGVATLAGGMPRVVGGQWRWRSIVAPPPDLDLLFSVLGRGLGLVETLQRAVVPLVEAPGAMHRDPHQVHLVERDPQRADGAFEDRRVGDIEREVF